MKKNYIYIVLDASMSMTPIKHSTMRAFDALTGAIQQQIPGQKNFVSLHTFNDLVQPPVFLHSDPEIIKPLTYLDYRPSGWTALFDGIGKAVEVLDKVKATKDTSFLVLVITDGEENHSKLYDATSIKKLMQRGDEWTFTFQLPIGKKDAFCRSFKIPEDNVREWEQTDEGTQTAFQQTSAGIGNYYQTRELGLRGTKQFFAPVTTNLEGVNVKRELDDISSKFKQYTVTTERVIKDFVESKTRQNYQPGQAFYQLMKKETVQPSKAVLIQEKGKKTVYGGPQARELIGLPDGKYAKVDPGNHANYDVFIQSKSVNRILPRGTKLLVEV